MPGGGEEALFGEGPGGVVVTVAPDAFGELAAICGDVPLVRLGETGGNAVVLEGPVATLSLQVTEAIAAYEDALSRSFE